MAEPLRKTDDRFHLAPVAHLVPIPKGDFFSGTDNEELEYLELERAIFVAHLMAKCGVSLGLVATGVLGNGPHSAFKIFPEGSYDSLKHVLIGDDLGGLHHLRTAMELEVPDRHVSTKLVDAEGNWDLRKYRGRQRVRDNGVFIAKNVSIEGVDTKKISGSTMFPNSWSTEKVIRALLAVRDEPEISEPASYPPNFRLKGEYDGVKLQVVIDGNDGKIMTGQPDYHG